MVQVMTTAESLLRQCGIQITDEGDILPAEPEIHLTTESVKLVFFLCTHVLISQPVY